MLLTGLEPATTRLQDEVSVIYTIISFHYYVEAGIKPAHFSYYFGR